MKRELITFVLGMLPISELRGAIPYGLASGLPLGRVLFLSIAGNLLPVVPVYFFLERILGYIGRFRAGARLAGWIVAHARGRSRIVEVYQTAGLLVFVGIPLPITGAWTGTLVAVLLRMRFRNFLLGVSGGVAMAAAIVASVWLTGAAILKLIFRIG